MKMQRDGCVGRRLDFRARLGRWWLGALLLWSGALSGADLVWNANTTGPWNVAGNWTPAQVPTAADNAFITNSGTYAVTVPAGTTAAPGTLTLGGATGTQTLFVDRATLTLANTSVISGHGVLELLVSQSVLTGAGNLTVNGVLNWDNGTISGTGLLSVGAGGMVAIGNGGTTLARTLNNSGTTTWGGGNLTLATGGVINSLAGAVFDVTADGHLSGLASTPVNNAGLFRQSAGTLGSIISVPFNNSGTLAVLAAPLSLNLGGAHTGLLTNAPGAGLTFGGGSNFLAAGSLVLGAGGVTVSGSGTTLGAGGTFDMSGSTLNVSAGVVTLFGPCNVTGTTLNISGAGGVVNFNSAGTVAAVNLAAGTLGGTSPVTVTGPLTLGGGTVTNALVVANGGLTINGNVTLNGARLINPTNAVWSAGNITGANGAAITNLAGGTIINSFDGNAAKGAGATPIFVNAGSFVKTDGTAALGTTAIDFQFLNTGTVEVRTNTLRYSVNQQAAGLTLLDGGGLAAQAQALQLLGGSLVGTGLVTVANTTNVLNSATISPGLPLGELDISGDYLQTASGALNIELGGYAAGTNFDLVTVSAGGAGGIATLGGTLNVTLVNGFSPTNGASFTFLTAITRSGAFPTFNYPSNDIGMQVSYDATSAKVTVSNLKPIVANPVSDPAPITYGGVFNLQFPANTFLDPDNDPLTYAASGMPPGVTFNGSTRTFSGTPTEAGVFLVTLVANDGGTPNLHATNTFHITVNPATLTVAAQAETKTYGAADPLLAYTVGGLQLSDTPATVLTGALSRTAGESVAGSPYPITQGTLAANSNYTMNFTGNTLTITKAALTVTADAKTKTYGASDPPFTATYAGFVNSETPAVLGGTLSFTRAPGENVGSYLITPGGLTSGNYAITFNTGMLTITKAALAVTADSETKTYGMADPVFTASYAGFVNGETAAVLGGTLSFTRVTGENIGSYAVTPGGLTSTNYAITFNAGTLTIVAPAPTLLPLAITGATNILITWSAVSNATYRVQYKPVLHATNWSDLAGDVLSSGITASKLDIRTATNRFYRVQVLP